MHYLLLRFVYSGLAIAAAGLSVPGLAAQVAKTQRGFFCGLPLSKQIAPVLFEITLENEPASDLISDSLRASFSHYKGLKGTFINIVGPGRLISALRMPIGNQARSLGDLSGEQILEHLEVQRPYSLVAVGRALRLATSGNSFWTDLFSKHSVVAMLEEGVWFAGFLWLDGNEKIHLSNHTGSYGTPDAKLDPMKYYLEREFGWRVEVHTWKDSLQMLTSSTSAHNSVPPDSRPVAR